MHRGARLAGRLLASGVVLGGLLWLAGGADVLGSLRSADPFLVGLTLASSVVGLFGWSQALARLNASLEGTPRGREFYGAYLSGVFMRSLLPWGRSAGGLVLAYVLSRRSKATYESHLATVTAADALNNAASMTVATAGLAYVLATRRLVADQLAVVALVGVGLTVSLLVGATLLLWPNALVRVGLVAARVLRATVGRVSHRAGALLEEEGVTERLGRFGTTLRSVAVDPELVGSTYAVALGAALLGVVPLYLSMRAVGLPVSYPMLMLVGPAAGLAGIVPLPGGTGGVEVAMTGLLALLTPHPLAALAAGVLLFRLSTYWFNIAVTGVVASLSVGTPPVEAVVD